MRKCVFLTLEDPSGFVMDDELAIEPLRVRGWQCEMEPWNRSTVDWARYDAIVIRSTWDYAQQAEQFLETLRRIEGTGVPVFNHVDLVAWNLEKTYLRELAERGVPIVPTTWHDRLDGAELRAILGELGSAVVKPVIGAGSVGAFRLHQQSSEAEVAAAATYYANRKAMIQPFLTNVTAKGEFSLFYFNGRYSHAILKTPQPHDFRVQEEHGGIIRAIEPDPELYAAGDVVLNSIDGPPLYARADFVRSNDGSEFWLMELELIEPALYLRMDPLAPVRFAEAIVERAS